MIIELFFLSSFTASSIHPKMNAADCLAPFVLYFTPEGEPGTVLTEHAQVTWTGKELKIRDDREKIDPQDEREDQERPEPLIVKFKKYFYLVYKEGKIKIHKVEEGGEKLIDDFFKIPPPPEPPKDSSDWERPTPGPTRWEWKP